MHRGRTITTNFYSLQLRTITLKLYVSTRQHVDTISVSLRLEADSGKLIVDASRPTLMAKKHWNFGTRTPRPLSTHREVPFVLRVSEDLRVAPAMNFDEGYQGI